MGALSSASNCSSGYDPRKGRQVPHLNSSFSVKSRSYRLIFEHKIDEGFIYNVVSKKCKLITVDDVIIMLYDVVIQGEI